MKVRAMSMIVAASYLIGGLLICLTISTWRAFLNESGVPQPIVTRVVFAIGPLGWLGLCTAIGSLAILKDLRFASPWLNLIFVLGFTILVGCIWAAIASPRFYPAQIGSAAPNNPAAPNAGIASQLAIGHHWPGVGEPERSAERRL